MSAWKRVPIGTLIESVETWDPTRAGPNGDFTYIDLSAVDQQAKSIVGARRLASVEAPSRARQLVKKGDILVSTVRPNLNGVARVPAALDGATASTGFCVLRPRPSDLDGGFLFHWATSPTFIKAMVNRATGASYPAVSDRIVGESSIPHPPLPEQRRIAEVLDRAEALRAKRRAALAQLDTLTQAIFLDMFGDPVRSPKYPTATIRPFAQASSGKSSKGVISNTMTGIPIYGGNGINGWATRPLYDAPVLVFGRVGQQCGITEMTDGPAWVTDNAIVVSISDEARLTVKYLLHAFRMTKFSERVKHLDLPFINQSMILDYRLCLPPLALQHEFARRVAAVEQLRSAHQASLAQLDELFASLQYRAFRGEL